MATLMRSNSDTGEVEIFSQYTGEIIFSHQFGNDLDARDMIDLHHKISESIRAAEKIAFKSGLNTAAQKIDAALLEIDRQL